MSNDKSNQSKSEPKKESESKKDVKGKLGFKSTYTKVVFAVVAGLLLVASYFAFLYASTPMHLRHPAFDHYHYRTQIIVDGEPVDFSRQEFQEPLNADATTCSAELSGTPFDFHDSEDQMTHVHWDGVTGGEMLKYYGWNIIGGSDDTLGRRFDQGMMSMHRIGIKGDVLPDIPENANFYVYIGDEDGYEQKSWDDFLNQDLEEFFGKDSLLNSGNIPFNILDLFSGKAFAHGGVQDEHAEEAASGGAEDAERLQRINNLIGNVVIFVQQEEPSDKQITARFNDLVPLHDSTCSG